jgi:hypothetical protein
MLKLKPCHLDAVGQLNSTHTKLNLTPWHESASELYQPSDLHLSAKLVPTFVDRARHVVSMTDLYFRILGFLDRHTPNEI